MYSQKWADYICAEDNQVFKKRKGKRKISVISALQMFWLCVKEFETAGDPGLQFTLVVYIYPPPSPATPSFFVLSRVYMETMSSVNVIPKGGRKTKIQRAENVDRYCNHRLFASVVDWLYIFSFFSYILVVCRCPCLRSQPGSQSR